MIENQITINNLSKVYDNGFTALKDINLGIKKGEIFAMLGPNGAGKTTLINIICGIVKPSAGNVSGLTHEVDMTTTVSNQWETLVYDFTGAPDLEYVSFIVFYDFGNTAGATYRFDEIQLID